MKLFSLSEPLFSDDHHLSNFSFDAVSVTISNLNLVESIDFQATTDDLSIVGPKKIETSNFSKVNPNLLVNDIFGLPARLKNMEIDFNIKQNIAKYCN